MYEKEHESEVLDDLEVHDLDSEEFDEELDDEMDRVEGAESGAYQYEDMWVNDEDDWG